mmetsp:Transcript_141637/g.394880  ORF Transcript_141637/g.394880 Transcript_141637/m.394880 type:complete len:255 (-) Transcript_141637:579-1343(-)
MGQGLESLLGLVVEDFGEDAPGLANHPPQASVPVAHGDNDEQHSHQGENLQEQQRTQFRLYPLPDDAQLGQAQHPHQAQEADELYCLRQLGHLGRVRGAGVTACDGLGEHGPGHSAHQVNAEPTPDVVPRDPRLPRDQRPWKAVGLAVICRVGREKVQCNVHREKASGKPEPSDVEGVAVVTVLISHLERQHHGVDQHSRDDRKIPNKPADPVGVEGPVHAPEVRDPLVGISLEDNVHHGAPPGWWRAPLRLPG